MIGLGVSVTQVAVRSRAMAVATQPLLTLLFSTPFRIGDTITSGVIGSATTGSTITCNVPGITVNSAARTYSGTPTGSPSASFGFNETPAGGGTPKFTAVNVLAAVAALGATTVTWDTPSSNITPKFTVTVANWQENDVLEFQLDTSSSFTSVAEAYSGPQYGMPATIVSDPLTAGTYYVRARATRGGVASAYSPTVTVTIATAPGTRIDDPATLFFSTTARIDL